MAIKCNKQEEEYARCIFPSSRFSFSSAICRLINFGNGSKTEKGKVDHPKDAFSLVRRRNSLSSSFFAHGMHTVKKVGGRPRGRRREKLPPFCSAILARCTRPESERRLRICHGLWRAPSSHGCKLQLFLRQGATNKTTEGWRRRHLCCFRR